MIYGQRKPQSLKDLMEDDFNPADMKPGYKRGLILKVYKAKLKELVGKDAIKSLLGDLKDITILPKTGRQYNNPVIILRFRPGSPWIPEMHARRYQLKMLLNKRLKSEFVKEVRIKS